MKRTSGLSIVRDQSASGGILLFAERVGQMPGRRACRASGAGRACASPGSTRGLRRTDPRRAEGPRRRPLYRQHVGFPATALPAIQDYRPDPAIDPAIGCGPACPVVWEGSGGPYRLPLSRFGKASPHRAGFGLIHRRDAVAASRTRPVKPLTLARVPSENGIFHDDRVSASHG